MDIKIKVSGYYLIIGYLGIITIMVGVITLLPLITLLFYPEESHQLSYFVIPGVIAILVGYLLSFIIKGKELEHLQHNQELLVVLGTWIIAIFVTALPFYLTGEYTLTEAIFETTSGLSTTGLSVVNTSTASHLFLMHRTMTLFVGGVGLVLVMTSIMSDIYGMRLYTAEGHNDKLLPNLFKSARLIIAIYSGYILAGIVLYIIAGMPIFDAVAHSVAALSTGGFSTHPESIGYYQNSLIEVITIVLMLLGGTNFFVHLLLLKGKFKNVFFHCETRLTITVVSFATVIMMVILTGSTLNNLSDNFRTAVFQVVSAITTTGFQTVASFNYWSPSLLLIMIVIMLIGGSSGSTAGGIKSYRIYILYKQISWELKKIISPKRVIVPNNIYKYNQHEIIDQKECHKVNIYVFIYLIIFIIGTFIFCLFGHSIQASMFEFASALSTVGLSMGIACKGASPIILWTTIIGMFLGRLEIYIVLISMIKIYKDGKKKIFMKIQRNKNEK